MAVDTETAGRDAFEMVNAARIADSHCPGSTFDEAIASFLHTYADQTDRHQLALAAVRNAEIKVVTSNGH